MDNLQKRAKRNEPRVLAIAQIPTGHFAKAHTYVTRFASISFVAPAHVRVDARAVHAARLTLRYAVQLLLVQLVADAALLHDALVDDGARFVHRPDLDAVRRTAGRYAETPLLVPLLVRFLARCRYRDGYAVEKEGRDGETLQLVHVAIYQASESCGVSVLDLSVLVRFN